MRHFPQRRKRKWDIEESQAMPRTRSLIIQRKTPFAGRVESALDYLNQAEPMNCRVRRTSYTMEGFCILYLLLIILMRSGDVETNPGPNTAESTSNDIDFQKLAQMMAPSDYLTIGIYLNISCAELEATLVFKGYQRAYLNVFMKWNVMQHPLSNKQQLLGDILRQGGISDRVLNGLLNGSPIPNGTADILEETTPQVKSERMTQEADSKVDDKKEKEKNEEDLTWDERDWNEKDLSDFETNASFSTRQRFDDEDDKEVAEEEEDVVSQTGKKVSEKTKKNTPPAHEDTSLVGKIILIIVADYIRPEDITNFSCVCKAASTTTRSVYFWKKFYFSYYNSSTTLPPYLQPERIEHTGLRTFVIRALYYLYEPYRLALNTTSPVGEGLSSTEAIKDFTCLYTWYHGKFRHPFTHFMKLRLCSREAACYNPNIFANDNRGECILRFHCEDFQDVPLAKIMGLQLMRSSVSVSANMRRHRVKLEFGRKDRRGLYVKSSIITVFLDPVLKVDVLHWWHPQFIKTLEISIAENSANSR